MLLRYQTPHCAQYIVEPSAQTDAIRYFSSVAIIVAQLACKVQVQVQSQTAHCLRHAVPCPVRLVMLHHLRRLVLQVCHDPISSIHSMRTAFGMG